jgi:hypothetical protein
MKLALVINPILLNNSESGWVSPPLNIVDPVSLEKSEGFSLPKKSWF